MAQTNTQRRRKVFAIGMMDSIHFARWLEQFTNEDIDFTLIPSGPHRRVHPRLGKLRKSPHLASYEFYLDRVPASLCIWILDRLLNTSLRGLIIRKLILRDKPDFVHALEIQNAGYATLAAYKGLPATRPRLVVTNYGSDIFWFKQFKSHLKKITALISITDVYAAECMRDVRLAKQLGFQGAVHSVHPNAGGFSEEIMERELPPLEERRSIAVKGYNGWAGRALVALRALYAERHALTNLKIEIFSANFSTSAYAWWLKLRGGMSIQVHRKGALTHEQVLDLFSRSRIYIGLSVTDGISTSMLEAMLTGAIPVQTASSCCDEWFDSSGVKVDNLDLRSVRGAILRGLSLSKSEGARLENKRTIDRRVSYENIRQDSLAIYVHPSSSR